ncbi:hypothetical protein GUJ93_ZPchr0001g31561 [Zizania palustris]|uniref:Uncharacterized protein n=1 Tax=Zizania palustris TaxID=103762 RepID=A0A8J5V290_ZIZPA|nr:hypothetical protein GUJ93_ZPchr0001g31561 [Zizania palustris]
MMTAAGNSFLNQDLAMTVGGMTNRYFSSSIHGGAAGYPSAGGSPVTVGAPDVSYLVAEIGMAPPGFVMPEGALSAAGYGAMANNVPVGAAMAPQQQTQQSRAGDRNGNKGPFKGAWTNAEDEILKRMVRQHGERKWAVISKSLPDRIGKQCRERWTNHLRPDIKKDAWTEEDDRVLIEAHKKYGNRWSAIARCLDGRSENAVKNHWNATKRSLKSKRRMKKKRSEQGAPGQLSLLEAYIRSQCPPAVDDGETAPAPPPPAPPSDVVGYSAGLVSPGGLSPPTPAQAPAGSNPPEIGIYLNLANPAERPPGPAPAPQQLGMMMNLNMPPVPDLSVFEQREGYYVPFTALHMQDNLHQHYGLHLHHVPAPAPAPPLQPQGICPQGMHVPFLSLYNNPFAGGHAGSVDYDCHCSSNQANVAGGYYSEAGPSSAGGGSGDPDDFDVVQMASRQFLMPSEDEVILDLTGFK